MCVNFLIENFQAGQYYIRFLCIEFQLVRIEGIKTVDEINAIYDCERIKINNNEHLLLVSLNRSFDDAKAQGVYQRINIYEKTRKYWSIAKFRVFNAEAMMNASLCSPSLLVKI